LRPAAVGVVVGLSVNDFSIPFATALMVAPGTLIAERPRTDPGACGKPHVENGVTVEPPRHRQTKEAATDMVDLRRRAASRLYHAAKSQHVRSRVSFRRQRKSARA
jgi:hypothetical protein